MKVLLKSSIELGNDVRLFRLRKHWSQRDLSIPLNVSTQAISNWERGASYMSLDIIVQLCDLMGMSLDDFLLIDHHGAYSYASLFDHFRLRDFWIDVYDIQRHPESGHITLDLRIQSDRYSHFIEDIFDATLLNEKEQEIPFVIEGWVDQTVLPTDQKTTSEVTRLYRIRYLPIHRPILLLIHYNGFVKHIELNESFMDAIIKGKLSEELIQTEPLIAQKIIDFYMKSHKLDQLMNFMHHQTPNV
jgi:transcriptional regulator with XRE-family HTH domain